MRYVAFLRAMNVGGRRIKMEALRSGLADLGYENVATYIASGNVIFDANRRPGLRSLEADIEQVCGFPAKVFLRNAAEVRTALVQNPWPDPNRKVEVAFLERAPEPEREQELVSTIDGDEALQVVGTELYWLRPPDGIETRHKESTVMRVLDMKTTRRAITTVEKIVTRFL